MSNFKALSDYQEIDFALLKLRVEVERNADMQRFEKTKAEYNAAHKTVSDNNEAAGKIVTFYQKTLEGYTDYMKKIDELIQKLEETPETDDAARKDVVLEIEAMRNRLASIEKRLNDSRANADVLIKTSTEARMRQKKLKEEGAKYSAAAEAFKKEREPRMAELSKKLALKRGEVDPKLMERYDRLAHDKKYPPLVAVKLIDKSYYCYCGIELSNSAKEELLEKGLCNCGNCGRMVYKD